MAVYLGGIKNVERVTDKPNYYVIKEITYYDGNNKFTDDFTISDFKSYFPKKYHSSTLSAAKKLIDKFINEK